MESYYKNYSNLNKETILSDILLKASESPIKKPIKKSLKKSIKKLPNIDTAERVESFQRFISILLKNKFPKNKISKDSRNILNKFSYKMIDKIFIEAQTLCKISQRKTISDNEIKSAIGLISFPEKIKKAAIEHGEKAVIDVETSNNKQKRSRINERAKLVFPVGRIGTYLRDNKQNWIKGIGKSAPTFLTGAIEYIILQILTLSHTNMQKEHKIIIQSVHIKEDSEIRKLLELF